MIPSAAGRVLAKFLLLKQNPLFSHSRRLAYEQVPSVLYLNGDRNFSTTSPMNFKVMIAGGAGGIGQALALLLMHDELVTHLSLFDIAKMTPGVAVDLSHMDYPVKVTGHTGTKELDAATKDAHVVVITAGLPRQPSMKTRDDLFNANAGIIRDIAQCVVKQSPKAVIAIITNPVNSLVPLASEVLKKGGVYDPAHVLGVTSVDVVRASTFVGELLGVSPRKVKVPVIGGHSGDTIIPVLSQSKPPLNIKDQKKIEALTTRIQMAGNEVVVAKAGGGSSTLSMAYAAARVTSAVLKGLNGNPDVVDWTYVKSDITEATYFAGPVKFGKNGISKVLDYGTLNKYEESLLKIAIPALIKNIKTGEDFVKKGK